MFIFRVVKGVDEYRKTGNIKSAGAIAAKSGVNECVRICFYYSSFESN